MALVSGCLLVGSVPLETPEAVFRRLAEALPDRLERLPDGETGSRIQFTMFQAGLFPPLALSICGDKRPLTESQIATLTRQMESLDLVTGYAEAALASYKVFKGLKENGTVPKAARFQVSLPTIANVVGTFIKPAMQPIVEPYYEAALFNALSQIQQHIPHEDLSIQLDFGVDLAFWEDLGMDMEFWDTVPWRPWFKDKSYVVDYVTRMIGQVATDVQLGLHFCYGDLNHKHYVEPKSLAGVADFYAHIMKNQQRAVKWIHCPVPLSATGALDDYFAPLSDLMPALNATDTKLYLGLVHANDLAGTRKRIEAAGKVARGFGVATECGLGRTPAEDVGGILEIMKQVSSPV